MKKAFIAIVEIEMAVLAETETEAQRIALANMNNEFIHPDDIKVGFLNRCPDGWEDECILYTDGIEEVTLKEALENKNA